MTLSNDQWQRVEAIEAVLKLYTGKDEPNALDVLAYAEWVLSGDQSTVLNLAKQQAALYGGAVTGHFVDESRSPVDWRGRGG